MAVNPMPEYSYTPIELQCVPFVVGPPCPNNSLEHRRILWRIAADRAVNGNWAEFGCGTSTGELLALMPQDGTLHCFDSEQGLPEPWPRGVDTKPTGSYSQRIPSNDPRAVKRVGWFADTLDGWNPGPLGLVHIDCDIYSSTITALNGCAEFCGTGTVVVFDELYGYPTYADHEWKAVNEWTAARGWSFEWVARGYYQVVGVLQC